MKKLLLTALLPTLLSAATLFSPALADGGLAAILNPAGLGVENGTDLYLMNEFFPGPSPRPNYFARQSLALRAGGAGLYLADRPFTYALGIGSAVGGNVYVGGRYFKQGRETGRWSAGALVRPVSLVSIGAYYDGIGDRRRGRFLAGIALRPGTDRITAALDVSRDSVWTPRVGLQVEPLPGLELAGRVDAHRTLELGILLSFGRAGIGVFSTGTTSAPLAPGTAFVRLGSRSQRSPLAVRRLLELRLAGTIADTRPGFSLFGPRVSATTWPILAALDKARRDPAIRSLLLVLDGPGLSLAHTQELRQALLDFRAAGKMVYAYAHGYGLTEYYLASVADSIYIPPAGGVVLPGMYAEADLLKGTLQKLGIEADVVRAGTYKSAMETFTEDTLSSALREELTSILDDNYATLVHDLAQARGRTDDEVRGWIDRTVFSAARADSAGIIDRVAYYDEIEKAARRGRSSVASGSYAGEEKWEYAWTGPPTIAIVYASGSITGGSSGTDPFLGETNLGAETICRALAKARDDRRVKAVLLRIDSPGGDGLASDLIWHQVELTRARKPVVVSMAGLAASGGYYIACNASRIFALPGTITGSIGVFGAKFTLAGLYGKLGMKSETIRRGEHADMNSDRRRWTEAEKAMIRTEVDEFYHDFVSKVAAGRALSYAHVDSVGQGRIWTGRQGTANGLVDELGGFTAALDWAKRQARIGTRVEYEFLPRAPSFNLRSLF